MIFTCLEGIDASGKLTQAKLLAERMKAKLFSFPDYTTPMGKILKQHLLNKWSAVSVGEDIELLDPMVFQAVQLANRMEHAQEIAEHLANGIPVVADRYTPSGMVYGGSDGLDADYLERIHRWLPIPNVHILVDIDPEQSAQRRPERRDRYEEQEGLMEDVTERYRNLWQEMSSRGYRWVVVDGRGSVGDVHKAILEVVEA